jgi:hypothetical protein
MCILYLCGVRLISAYVSIGTKLDHRFCAEGHVNLCFASVFEKHNFVLNSICTNLHEE